jgi:HAD superfamily hydrolase (TIGR01509 family)
MKVKAIIFDKDGVIVDTQPVHFRVFNDYCQLNGWTVTHGEYESFQGTTSTEMFSRIQKAYKVNRSAQELSDEFQTYYMDALAAAPELKLIDEVVHLIQYCYNRGFKLAIASSATRKKIELIMNLFELSPYFQVTVSGHEVARSKPHPDIFLRAAQLLDVQPEDCVVIEDSRNGIMGAKAAQMRTIGYQNPLGNQDLSEADLLIHHFGELMNGSLTANFLH